MRMFSIIASRKHLFDFTYAKVRLDHGLKLLFGLADHRAWHITPFKIQVITNLQLDLIMKSILHDLSIFFMPNSDKFGTKLGSVDTSSMFATWEIYLARFFSWYKAWGRKFSHSKWLTHNAIAAKNMLVLRCALRCKQSSACFCSGCG